MNLLDMLRSPARRVPEPGAARPGIIDIPDPDRVIIALEYPGKILFRPVVKEGDTVAANQLIGRSGQGNCLHASIGGTVQEIRPVWSATSDHVPAVVIARSEVPPLSPERVLAQAGLELTRATRVELMKACGVVSPWTTPGPNDSEEDVARYPEVRHLVIVGVNQEPTTVNYELLLQQEVEAVKTGLHRLQEFCPRVRPRLLVAAGMASWARQELGDSLDIVPLGADYRRRIRRLVIPELTGEKVAATEAFRAHGIASITVEQLLAMVDSQAGLPFVRKTVSVAGAGLDGTVTVRVPVGTPVRWILEQLDLPEPRGGRLIMGGPMRGMAHYTLDAPVSKFENGVYLLDREHLPSEVNLTCINCGICTRTCPVGLQVHLLGRCVEFGSLSDTPRYHPEACLECGLCAFVCPAHRPLVQMIKMAKKYGG